MTRDTSKMLMTSAGVTRRRFLRVGGLGICGGLSQILKEAGLLAQGRRGVDPNRVFQIAIDSALARGEAGIQCAVYKDGKLVVDVWGGVADTASGRKVDGDTLFNVYSVSKAVTSTAVHLQAERGLIEYEKPVAHYWPEFAANDKDGITIRDTLSHRAGLPYVPEGLTPEQMCDYDWMVRRIAAMKPVFQPGTTNAYHLILRGWILAECIRRTDRKGRRYGQFVQDEICGPLRIRDLWFGIPDSVEGRVATMVNDPVPRSPDDPFLKGFPAAIDGTARRDGAQGVWGRRDVRRAAVPDGGGIFNARSEARFWAMLANRGELDGVRLLSPKRVDGFFQVRPDSDKPDRILGSVAPVSTAGYWLTGGAVPNQGVVVGKGRILYHAGLGGSIGWADLDNNLAIAVCHNRHGNAYGAPLRTAFGEAFAIN